LTEVEAGFKGETLAAAIAGKLVDMDLTEALKLLEEKRVPCCGGILQS